MVDEDEFLRVIAPMELLLRQAEAMELQKKTVDKDPLDYKEFEMDSNDQFQVCFHLLLTQFDSFRYVYIQFRISEKRISLHWVNEHCWLPTLWTAFHVGRLVSLSTQDYRTVYYYYYYFTTTHRDSKALVDYLFLFVYTGIFWICSPTNVSSAANTKCFYWKSSCGVCISYARAREKTSFVDVTEALHSFFIINFMLLNITNTNS